MPTIRHDNSHFDYTVVRTSRRTIAIYIDPLKGVIVRAPKRGHTSEIRQFLIKKTPWILRKLHEMQKREAEAPQHTYLDGDDFLYLGNSYALKFCPDMARKGIAIVDSEIVVSLKPDISLEKIPDMLRKWYIARAREILNERVLFYSQELGVKPARVAIRGQSKRWGSCSAKGNLNLNWKLVMAPPIILDYVVVHELCHLRHPNHQLEFWQMLGDLMPDYAIRRDWLKQNGHKLGL
ncbi:MAG: M48 family metallopeptidase [Thermoplasmata archaeon]|nr:M48 family metallopeptidase [Thermoplasmata archaeon]